MELKTVAIIIEENTRLRRDGSVGAARMTASSNKPLTEVNNNEKSNYET
jgi:hypothetical protein